MIAGRLRVLVLEDSELDAMMVAARLDEQFDLEFATTVADGLARIREQMPDCILADLMLPDGRGLETLEIVGAAAPDSAIVVLSGSEDEQIALTAVQQGAQDYLVKGHTGAELLRRSILYATERKRIGARLARLALYDTLTGLPNRTLLNDRLTLALARARRRGPAGTVAVLFLDVDRFKLVNDTLGHDAGDRLLCDLATRIMGAVRPSDTVARLGGDEFVVLCDGLPDALSADAVAGRILEALDSPFSIGGAAHHLSVSVGIAVADEGTSTAPEMLLSNADAAMYRAKAHGGGVEFFSHGMREDATRRLALHNELHRALEEDELVVHYQPQIGIAGAEMTGVEALVRWRHPQRGLVMPAGFIPLAEETGLIVELGEWVLREACRQLAAWREEGLVGDELSMGVNLSARQLAQAGIVATVRSAIEDAGIPAERLCLEITESTVMHDTDAAVERLHALKALGVRLAIDDFGTGYSSLTHMHRFPLDVLKIDRSFVAGCDANKQSRGIVEAVIRLAGALGLTPVAEGVESAQQADALEALGCATAQGFLFAAAEPAAMVTGRLSARGALASVPPVAPVVSGRPVRVLICDDVAETRLLVRSQLERQPAVRVVAEAANGRAALDALAAAAPDIVILDLGMPIMDGIAVLPLVSRLAPRSRVIVMTGREEPGLTERVMTLGADRCIPKSRLLFDLPDAVSSLAGA